MTKGRPAGPGITPFLWFDDQAEAAVDFYVALFDDAEIVQVSRYGKAAAAAAGRAAGSVMTIAFRLRGQDFVALNGGPVFSFSPATSFVVGCQTQDELDGLWDALAEGGQVRQCGWLTDRFGVTWQLVPQRLGEMMSDPDPQRSQRVMQALLKMTRIDIQQLERARGGP